MCREAGVAYVDDHPTGAYLLIEREFVLSCARFHRAARAFESTPARGDTEKKTCKSTSSGLSFLAALAAARRRRHHIFGHRYSSAGDGMIYSAPEFSSDMTGDRLLTEITELVVRFGNEMKTAASSQRGRWIFSAISCQITPPCRLGSRVWWLRRRAKIHPIYLA